MQKYFLACDSGGKLSVFSLVFWTNGVNHVYGKDENTLINKEQAVPPEQGRDNKDTAVFRLGRTAAADNSREPLDIIIKTLQIYYGKHQYDG
ncbi:MAG TPA: hypothetical protein DD640_08125 [Clostridiales bacterium]|nr:hypothetical protein [Clostridiales bacterium]